MSAASIDETVDLERKPNLVRDICALVLIAFTLILTVSLVTHNAADPLDTPIWPISEFYTPDATIFPPNATITNACGYWGALLSSLLLDALGVASAIVIGALGGVATALILRGSLNAPVLRSLGGTIIVIAVATGGAMLPLQASGLPVVGGGGFLGAMTSTWLLEHFAPAGAWILTMTLFLVGTLMTSDYALLYASKRLLKEGGKVSRSGLKRASKALPGPRRRRPFTDLEEPIKIDGDGDGDVDGSASPERAARGEPTIKFRQPKKKPKEEARDLEVIEDEVVEEELADSDDDNEDADEWDDDDAEEDSNDVSERELDIRSEKHTVRKDESHHLPQPKVKVPKRKTKSESSENLFEDMNESLPGGMEDYRLPGIDLLEQSDDVCYEEQLHEVRRKAHVLEETFRDFGFNIRVVEIETGPVIAQYEIELEAGLRLSKITGLADDLAIALRVPSVRIVAPIPGKNTVGIEVPNETRQAVRLRDVIEESDTRSAKMNIPVFLGKDVSGNPMVVDLAKMPHLLIAGRTGTGKSVCLNAIITSVLMCCRPDEVRMLMIDPKMVELSGYGRLPHLMHPVITDMKKAEAILAWAVEKMEERYSLLAKVGVRHINSFNDLGREEIMRRLEIDAADATQDVPEKLPFIVIIADEMADLMMTAGKDVEQPCGAR
jgi:S-DNA-T family DNA segregation ATPase FtsK/SpoIIIE